MTQQETRTADIPAQRTRDQATPAYEVVVLKQGKHTHKGKDCGVDNIPAAVRTNTRTLRGDSNFTSKYPQVAAITNDNKLVLWGARTAPPKKDFPTDGVQEFQMSSHESQSWWWALASRSTYELEIEKDSGITKFFKKYGGKIDSFAYTGGLFTAVVGGKAIACSWNSREDKDIVEGKGELSGGLKWVCGELAQKSSGKMLRWSPEDGKERPMGDITLPADIVGMSPLTSSYGMSALLWSKSGELFLVWGYHKEPIRMKELHSDLKSGVTFASVYNGPTILVVKNGQVYTFDYGKNNPGPPKLVKELGTGVVEAVSDGQCIIALRKYTKKLDKVAITSGGGQTAEVNTAFGKPITAKATLNTTGSKDQHITWTVQDTGKTGSHFEGKKAGESLTTVTGSDGTTSVRLVAGPTPGTCTIQAQSVTDPSLKDTCQATVTAKKPTVDKLAPVTGTTPQTQQTGKPFAKALAATATLAGKPAKKVEVTFTIPDNDTTGSRFHPSGGQPTKSVTRTTDNNGVAEAPQLMAGATAGSLTVTAKAGDPKTGPSTTFDLTVTAAPKITVDKVQAHSGNNQSTEPGKTFTDPLCAKATLKGQPVANTGIAFAIKDATTNGATFVDGKTATEATTDSQGVATSPKIKAGASYVGAIIVTATSKAHPDKSATFTLTTAKKPSRKQIKTISTNSGSGQKVKVNTKVPTKISVTARDNEGNAVQGAPIKFAVPSELTFKDGKGAKVDHCFGTTDANGAASHGLDLYTLDKTGTYKVTVTAPEDPGANPAEPTVDVIK